MFGADINAVGRGGVVTRVRQVSRVNIIRGGTAFARCCATRRVRK